MDAHKEQAEPAPVVGQQESRRQKLSALVSTPRNRWIVIVVAAVLVAGLGAWAYYRHQAALNNGGPKTFIASESEVLASEVKTIKSTPPATTAPLEEKLQYYDKLFRAQINAETYKEAVATFEQRQAISVAGLQYYDYFTAAQAYCKLSDKEHARKAFDDLQAVLPAADDASTGYSREGVLNSVDFTSKECGL